MIWGSQSTMAGIDCSNQC